MKKSIFKRWWFWVLAVVVVIAIIAGSSGGDDTSTNVDNNDSVTGTTVASDTVAETQKNEITYEKIDLQALLDELDANALKAEKIYQNKHVEVTGKIKNFDSDGSYISIEPLGADEWNFATVMCKIKNDEQLNFLLDKQVGDEVTVKGKITSIGEVLGYTIDMAAVQ